MTTAPAKKARQMPKGGRKGGSVFPRTSLTEALGYARKLVSKTHTGPQPAEVVLSGVVGSKTDTGRIRMSALKQYGLLEGDAKANFSASELAKKLAAAPADEAVPLLRQAMLNPTVFRKLFDTFHGDAVSKAKLKQRAADLNVHPDSTASCVDLYVSGMTTAGLVTVVGDQVKHIASSDLAQPPATDTAAADTELDALDEEVAGNDLNPGDADQAGLPADAPANGAKPTRASVPDGIAAAGPRAVFNVNVTLDSSLDIEKLQKQLELLKRFGAI